MSINQLKQTTQQSEQSISHGLEEMHQSLFETLSNQAHTITKSDSDVANYMGQMSMAIGKFSLLGHFLRQDGVVITWNRSICTLSTHTLNGVMIARAHFLLSGDVSRMEVSSDGQSLLIGLNPCLGNNEADRTKSKKVETVSSDPVSNENDDIERLDVPSPLICFLDLHSLKAFHTLKLKEGQDITTLAMNKDNTNLLVSTADKQLIVFTDPTLSLKVVDQMLKLGWEGDGLSPFMK